MSNPFASWSWSGPEQAQRLETIDMHTGGEPLRVITAGLPPLPGATVLEKRQWFRENLDHVRTALMWEPRGHADMYGAVLDRAADDAFDVFFLHNEGYSTMCGHAIIALTRLVVETGLVAADCAEIVFNVPAGRIVAHPRIEQGVIGARFRNVPCYVALDGGAIALPEIGEVRFAIAFGGAYYAIVEAGPLGLDLTVADHGRLIDLGRRIKLAVASAHPIVHPEEPDLSFLYGTIFTGPAENGRHHSRNVCIFADGELDRSPTGSGVSARAALHAARGELRRGETMTIESIVGSTMTATLVEETAFGGYPAVIAEVGGTAHFTGRHSFWIEPDDPLRAGFLIR